MNCSTKIILASLTASSICGAVLIRRARQAVKNLPDGFTVTAHTGCEGTRANSLSSIEAAIRSRAHITEFDLRFDSQGKGILSHDENEENPVSLECAFEAVTASEKLLVNIDVKSADNLGEVVSLAKKQGISERIFYTGIEEKDVATVKRDSPSVAYYLNRKLDIKKRCNEQYILEHIALVKNLGATGLNLQYLQGSKKIAHMLHKEGLKLSLWTADCYGEMISCILKEPDNITTRKPEKLIGLIEFLSK